MVLGEGQMGNVGYTGSRESRRWNRDERQVGKLDLQKGKRMTGYMRDKRRTGLQVLMAMAALACGGAVACGNWEQEHKLTASDGAARHCFGEVAVEGNYVVVGAPGHWEDVDKTGWAYVFDTTTGNELHKLVASDASPGDFFGWDVAISGVTIVTGADSDDEYGENSGSAYLFDAVSGAEIRKLYASDAWPEAYFGWSVDISGDFVLVGSPYADFASYDQLGAAYIFDASSGQQLHKLVPNDPHDEKRFGFSVAIDGNFAVIGAFCDDQGGYQAGAAYVFDVTTGSLLRKLIASDADEDDWFGHSVSISGTTIAIGAPYNDDMGFMTGSAYLFDATTGNQLHKLLADDAASGEGIGYSVAVYGSLLVAGAHQDDDGGESSGSAFVFDVSSGNQLDKIIADDDQAFDFFGNRVALYNDVIAVGAYGDDDLGPYSGSAYVFVPGGEPCPSDINGDGVVNTADLLQLLGDWGACP